MSKAATYSTIIQWLAIIAISAGIYFTGWYLSFQIVALSFSCAFTWVHILKIGKFKPLNCLTCMSGWFALAIGFYNCGLWGIVYVPVAMTLAAIYTEIRMKLL